MPRPVPRLAIEHRVQRLRVLVENRLRNRLQTLTLVSCLTTHSNRSLRPVATCTACPSSRRPRARPVCSKGVRQQLHRLRPLVGVTSLAVVRRPTHGPWRVALMYAHQRADRGGCGSGAAGARTLDQDEPCIRGVHWILRWQRAWCRSCWARAARCSSSICGPICTCGNGWTRMAGLERAHATRERRSLARQRCAVRCCARYA